MGGQQLIPSGLIVGGPLESSTPNGLIVFFFIWLVLFYYGYNGLFWSWTFKPHPVDIHKFSFGGYFPNLKAVYFVELVLEYGYGINGWNNDGSL